MTDAPDDDVAIAGAKRWLNGGESHLDAWTVSHAYLALVERERRLREALIQARGALKCDAMLDEHGLHYGTTTVALEAINAALDDRT